ncbi:formylglycine-generating enzyme family protein [Luteococcus japonicus]|uniref:Sulfatase-modifying factor enzyme-like domain-containing protein n=1 Tax=Luteococcus japonicus LSP_Lj1 TaxID=1255658 RepID=A0A1R4INY3_9ACTN|nr:SUMF1/EgtB/PvdO family nonheme iron enzyme [Luteococcus japonicus]SJN21566.1 protein of unknown function DUF323 [Luteococcus japonicus LSP_Lj1]
MSVDLIAMPFRDTVEELVVDRGTGRSWTVPVEPFELSPVVVTRSLWNQVQGGTVNADLADLPQTEVSWRDAIQFCNALSIQDGFTPVYTISQREVPTPTQWRPHGQPEVDDWVIEWDHEADGYRLPTDAEWQLACRAGTTGPRYAQLDDIGWYADNSGGRAHPVRLKQPNEWGLFDMLGGVWEWCWDLYDPDVYGSYRIIRGGGWSDPQWSCRAGVRRKTNPASSFDDLGFRIGRGVSSALAVRRA